MPRISDSAIDEVRAANDLVDVVSDRVKLKKQGRRFVGLCPFHNEKTPSFSVDAAEGLYYCFGCSRGGDLFKFVQEVEGVGFLDSVRLLADRAGIVIEEDAATPADDRRASLHAALRFAAGFFFEQLKGDAGERARAYLQERGFSKEAVLAFGIGAAPDSWDALTEAGQKAGYGLDVLEAVGLVKRRERGDGAYDVFRDRLVFPILSPIGKVLGFGGRILPGSPTASADYTPAKYINTPETEVYHKSRVLYGMKQAKRAIRTQEEAIVVEGYADVVALWQAGVQNVVAASGTALTPQQMDLLARLDVQRVVLLFDADGAGQKAARKGVDVALDAGIAPYAVTLPDGADPDSFVRQFGAEAFVRFLDDERMDFVAFLARGARREGRLATPEGKAAAVDEVLASIRRLDNPIRIDETLRRAAAAFDVYDADLRRQYEKTGGSGPARRRPARASEAQPPTDAPAPIVVPVRPQEGVLLRLMLREGRDMVEHVMSQIGLDMFSAGPMREAAGHLVAQFEAGAVDAGPFVQGEFGEPVRALVTRTLAEKHAISDNWASHTGAEPREAEPSRVADSAIRLLKLARVREAIEGLKRELAGAEQAGADVEPIQRRIIDYTTLMQEIEGGGRA